MTADALCAECSPECLVTSGGAPSPLRFPLPYEEPLLLELLALAEHNLHRLCVLLCLGEQVRRFV